MNLSTVAALALLLTATAAAVPVRAQTEAPSSAGQQPAPAEAAQAPSAPAYRPPVRGGAPGGRVGGASRSAALPGAAMPVVELFAPADHTGLTARPDPTLYFFLSRASQWPVQLTISAPGQPDPVLEINLPSPLPAGVHAAPLAGYNVKLQPDVVYTWSVSIVLDPRAWSHNVVGSATIAFDPTLLPAVSGATEPAQRAGLSARAGLWYDAISAAMDEQTLDRRNAVGSLLRQVGLGGAEPMAQSGRFR